MGELNVSFQSDTDNIENFPSPVAFRAFKKQRDLFYEILRTWQENHHRQTWSFEITLARKIQTMLRLHDDAANYCHFARLFKSQILISCIQNTHEDDVADDESLSFLRTLKHVNPEKLTQLKKRLVTPLPPKEYVGQPFFPGVQEFFKDFIIHAFNPIFYVHLENCLVREILELNETQFTSSEIEDSETMVDDRTRENFIVCLSSLRVLAKMLGLLVSLPYKLHSHNTETTIALQLEMRSKVLPSLNLDACLRKAVVRRNLSLTIPWLAEYLAMMDDVALRLPYYKRILELLYYVHWTMKHFDLASIVSVTANARNPNVSASASANATGGGNITCSTVDNAVSKRAGLLIKTILTRLFEISNVPKDQFATWTKNCVSWELKSLSQLSKHYFEASLVPSSAVAAVEPVPSVPHTAKGGNLDELDIIDDRVLRACCPTLELKGSATIIGTTTTSSSKAGAVGTVVPAVGTSLRAHSNRSNSNKHITPVSSQLWRKANCGAHAKHLQKKLEDAFFHGQPASTRKTVDFVAERVASTCVKHICNKLLSSARENNLNAFRKIIRRVQSERQLREEQQREEDRRNNTDESVAVTSNLPTNISNSDNLLNDTESFKSHLVRDMKALALNQSKDLKNECDRTVLAICEARVTKAIESLLAEDSLPAVKEACFKIAVRLAMERINEWIQSHIVGGTLFIRDMETEMNRVFKDSNPIHSARRRQHNANAPSPAKVMYLLRSLIRDLVETGGDCLTEAIVLSALQGLDETLHERSDLLPCPEEMLFSLSVDFTLFLISYRMDLCTDKVQERLIQLWSMEHSNVQEPISPLSRLLSPRNVMLLGQSEHLDIWVTFGKFIRKLLKNEILHIDVLGDQCVALFRQCWPVPILKLMSQCLREAIEDYDASGEEAEKIKYLLGWIVNISHETEIYDDYMRN